jgi:uncharacterized membrane protein YedE/YeeE
MRGVIAAFVAGSLFGLGLTVSRMIDPAKVLGFLDVAGNWDPSLALVMAGALTVMAIAYRIAMGRRAPLLAGTFQIPTRRDVDARLVSGAVVFGVGWGLVGFCPGPAISGLALGRHEVYVFVLAMLAGMAVQRYGPWRERPEGRRAQQAPAG